MGEMADFYVDRMLDKHISAMPSYNRSNYMEKYQLMDDKQLMDSVRKAIRAKGCNDSFLSTAEKILLSPPMLLSEKQRSCFLGLLNVQGDKTSYLQGLSDEELLELSQQAVQEKLFNEDFGAFGKKIVNDKPKQLSQKQRNGLLGFLNW